MSDPSRRILGLSQADKYLGTIGINSIMENHFKNVLSGTNIPFFHLKVDLFDNPLLDQREIVISYRTYEPFIHNENPSMRYHPSVLLQQFTKAFKSVISRSVFECDNAIDLVRAELHMLECEMVKDTEKTLEKYRNLKVDTKEVKDYIKGRYPYEFLLKRSPMIFGGASVKDYVKYYTT